MAVHGLLLWCANYIPRLEYNSRKTTTLNGHLPQHKFQILIIKSSISIYIAKA
jgi:hypothetical protein